MTDIAYSFNVEHLSSDQQRLIKTALDLLSSSLATQNGPYYTRRKRSFGEKAKWLIGMMLGSTINDFSGKISSETITQNVEVRSAGLKHGPEASSEGGVYLQKEQLRNLDTNTVKESLILFASAVTNKKFTFIDQKNINRDVLWQESLLEPIKDVNEIKRFQLELDSAVERFRHNE
jgi:hypothetical protein